MLHTCICALTIVLLQIILEYRQVLSGLLGLLVTLLIIIVSISSCFCPLLGKEG